MPNSARDSPRVFAIIPAAGRSRRMGSPKQLLEIHGRPMLLTVIESLLASRVAGVVVVTHSALEVSARGMCGDSRVFLVINDDESSEMIDSVRIGLRTWCKREVIHDHDGFLVCPGDHPGIFTVDFDACIAAFCGAPDRIIVAARDGRRGHPLIFPCSKVDFVESTACDQGLNAILRSDPARVIMVACQSSGVIADVDTPQDHGRHTRSSADQPG